MKEQLARWWRFIKSLWTLFREKNCQQSAAALTYMTLFALVPLVTVSYAMLSLFPDFADLQAKLQELIFAHFVPESGREIEDYLAGFSQQAQRLSGAGVAMLLLTAGLMLRNIEHTFNAIWDIPRGRKGVASFLLYWAILSLGPLLLGMGLASSTYLLSMQFLVEDPESLGLMSGILKFMPYVLTTAAFTLLFVAVPNCRVPIRHGLVGGLIAALAFEAAKNAFGTIVAKTSLQAIYGAFAFVPLFLIWVYLMWIIVLIGAVLVRTLSAYHAAAQGRDHTDLVSAMSVLWRMFSNQQKGRPLSEQDVFRAGIKPAQWRRLRQMLQKRKVIAATDKGEYLLAMDLNKLSLSQLGEWISPSLVGQHANGRLAGEAWYDEVYRRFANAEKKSRTQLDISLDALFRGIYAGEQERIANEKQQQDQAESSADVKKSKDRASGSGSGKKPVEQDGGGVGRRFFVRATD
ncbi:YihY family inner membrane protein [Biformimicrobium ophioploci]|uniref:UPF0761 membrane protein MNKW57_28670 n=1 Tax=Biformimicrobium ophioploci TaxID=3036711 RepID=A0ABQ6M2K0_9GAMM|nr:YihY family inner membrane protein [Microbulbifer sp. NKW57]GMG88546.1 YihY family inner membrane protein [Microbulbifer sp. NKW57]